ncbi:EF-P lysine aminoacylase GenX [Candidatus Peregrinibacteria bacterium]|nr:EF-P lysine aminoacylase GenX [Candidatus Peregrinibacteria bacterium]
MKDINPVKIKRDCNLVDVSKTDESILYVVGRVVGIIKEGDMAFNGEKSQAGFYLQDESARLFFEFDGKVDIGSIVQARLKGGKVEKILRLAECADFFIIPSSENYKKIIIDKSLESKLKTRSKVLQLIRQFFLDMGFVETDTPSMVKLPGMEPNLEVFKTNYKANVGEMKIEEDRYLITSPEYAMKKLLVSGMEKIFQLTKSFRNNESFSALHNPEFTLLEWYRAYGSYLDMMEDTENLVKFLCERLGVEGVLQFGEMQIDVSSDFERLSVKEAFKKYAEMDLEDIADLVNGDISYEEAFFSVFLNKIEKHLGVEKPVFLYDYPVQMAALAKVKESDTKYAERFELYIGGMELCNAFSELNDPVEQKRRLQTEREERKKMGKSDYEVDRSFIDALEFGMPPAGGNALGVDRLIMLLTDTADIKDILFFPERDL